MDIQLSVLFDSIIESCREYAANMPRFSDGDGAIRINYLPQSEFGRAQCQSLTKHGSRVEIVAPISEGGMQVATCLRNQEIGDKKEQFQDEKHGYASSSGVLSCQLLYDHAIFALLLISISGATPEEDELVAKHAIDSIIAWCKTGPHDGERARLFFIPN